MKIKKNVPLSDEEGPRNEWPFGDMKVGDVVEIKDKSKWLKATRYAHSFAQKHEMKMQTKWLASKNLGRIRRVS